MRRPELAWNCGDMEGYNVQHIDERKVEVGRWGSGGAGVVRMMTIFFLCLKQFLKVKIELNLKSNLKDNNCLVYYMVGHFP